MIHRPRASFFALAALLLLGSASLGQEKRGEGKRDLDATELGRTLLELDDTIDVNETLDLWAERLGGRHVRGYGMDGMKIKLHLGQDAQKLTWGSFKRILDASNVLVLEERVQGGLLLLSVTRNGMGNVSVIPAAVVTSTAALPPREEFVTAILTVEHASAVDVFNVLRYLDAYAPSRRGLVQLVPSTNSIVIHDLVSTVDYCRKVALALDVPCELSTAVLPVRATDARTVATAITSLYPHAETRVDACAVGSAVAVRAPSERLASIETLVAQLEAASR
ncbi:MAG TPA: hypothetical protein VFF73_36595 [Planctomycetota bacterium]|nr:hypothetical protein [Planctomycetota bacterium]